MKRYYDKFITECVCGRVSSLSKAGEDYTRRLGKIFGSSINTTQYYNRSRIASNSNSNKSISG